jgi:hypothetical protein
MPASGAASLHAYRTGSLGRAAAGLLLQHPGNDFAGMRLDRDRAGSGDPEQVSAGQFQSGKNAGRLDGKSNRQGESINNPKFRHISQINPASASRAYLASFVSSLSFTRKL